MGSLSANSLENIIDSYCTIMGKYLLTIYIYAIFSDLDKRFRNHCRRCGSILPYQQSHDVRHQCGGRIQIYQTSVSDNTTKHSGNQNTSRNSQ